MSSPVPPPKAGRPLLFDLSERRRRSSKRTRAVWTAIVAIGVVAVAVSPWPW